MHSVCIFRLLLRQTHTSHRHCCSRAFVFSLTLLHTVVCFPLLFSLFLLFSTEYSPTLLRAAGIYSLYSGLFSSPHYPQLLSPPLESSPVLLLLLLLPFCLCPPPPPADACVCFGISRRRSSFLSNERGSFLSFPFLGRFAVHLLMALASSRSSGSSGNDSSQSAKRTLTSIVWRAPFFFMRAFSGAGVTKRILAPGDGQTDKQTVCW